MKKILTLFKTDKEQKKQPLDSTEAKIIKQGREQFQKLVARGLQIPVAYL